MGKFSKNGLAMVRKDLNRGFIDAEGNEVVPLMYFWASDFNEGLALVEDLSGAFGYINNKCVNKQISISKIRNIEIIV